jgi:nitroreductase
MPHFIDQLAATGALAPSADNSQPWHMDWSNGKLALRHVVRHAATNVFHARSHATLLGLGALAENLDMTLVANGVSGQWQWQDNSDGTYATLALDPVPAAFTAPAGPAARHTNRLPFTKAAVPPALVARLTASNQGGNRITVLQDREKRRALVGLVQAASRARFCDRALHAWLYGSLRHTPEEVARGDGLDMASLGLPPGGKALMALMSDWPRMEMLNRIGAYKLLAKAETGLIGAAPALICLSGPSNDAGVIDGGRLLNRVWTSLNLEGLAVQPYYVVSDQLNRLRDGSLAAGFEAEMRAAETRLRSLLGLQPGEMLHMILRVGYPKQTAVRSRRLPLSSVYSAA